MGDDSNCTSCCLATKARSSCEFELDSYSVLKGGWHWSLKVSERLDAFLCVGQAGLALFIEARGDLAWSGVPVLIGVVFFDALEKISVVIGRV